jgi:hypothetical protein
MATIIQFRRDTTTNWSTENPILAEGELAFDTVLKKFKVGDGSTAYNSLDYIIPSIPLNLSSGPADNDVLIYDSGNSTWVSEQVNVSDYLPFQLKTTGNAITKSDGTTAVLYESNSTAILDNITLGSNVGGLGSLTANFYALTLTNNNTEINFYTAENADNVVFDDYENYAIETNANFQILNNNLVMVL